MSENLQSTEQSEVLRKLHDMTILLMACRDKLDYILEYNEPTIDPEGDEI